MTDGQGSPSRLPLLDVMRGLALLLMASYHLAWDLVYFGLADIPLFSAPAWIFYPRFIAALFLFIVGIGLALWWRAGANRARYLRRLGLVSACAGIITLATWAAFPAQYVFFGILHCIALSSLAALPFLRGSPRTAVAGGLLCLAAPWLFAAPIFDAPALLWLGLATLRPSTVDYVPLFPWVGWVLLGTAAGRWNLVPTGGLPRFLIPPAWLGRHSLAVYMLHQPLLFGLVYLIALVSAP
ncbi:MAG: DUF1624 domain-containing protein [Magnetospirillum sp. WYHS-4]